MGQPASAKIEEGDGTLDNAQRYANIIVEPIPLCTMKMNESIIA